MPVNIEAMTVANGEPTDQPIFGDDGSVAPSHETSRI